MSKDFSYTDLRPAGIPLTGAQTRHLAGAALRIARAYDGRSLHDDELLHEVELAAVALPATVRRALISFRDKGNPAGCLLLTGLPLGQLPATPSQVADEPEWARVGVPTLVQLMVMSVLGRAISYSDEKNGRLIQDVSPKAGEETRQENSGSVLLELHTEDGFHPNPPHFLSLICLRGDPAAATVTAGIGDILPLLDEATVTALHRPEYAIRYSSSFVGDTRTQVTTDPMPVLSGSGGCPNLCVDFHATVARTPRAQEALDHLNEAMLRSLKGTTLLPGDLVVVDNRRAVHGRSAFAPRYDGRDRWLRRCFALADLRPVAGHLGRGRSHKPITVAVPAAG
ncbi:TauD/TfdA family dioxygenase [Streptomyces sp. WM6386]|uniref:TauD/TfdA family dioxygenase n=1 Tax=Streptomyces sp. WM6386 TaxID=1415558 RepID=UPI000696EDB8|nr:TauD/TfdA family dioxygenase [Streptomyces sp. WM6386]